jgi:hypothetical protein
MRDIRIRTATLPDIPHVLHHRSSMYVDMGRGNAAEHATMLETTRAFLNSAMPSGAYVGWLAETAEGRVVAGAGVTIFAWPGSPDDPPAGVRCRMSTQNTSSAARAARRLMVTAIAWCRDQGLRSVSPCQRFRRPLYESGIPPDQQCAFSK